LFLLIAMIYKHKFINTQKVVNMLYINYSIFILKKQKELEISNS